MYNLCIRCKFMKFPCNPIIKTSTDRKQQIAFAHCHVRGIRPMHSQVSDKQRMICRNRASSHDRRHYRNVCYIDYFRKLFIRSCDIHSASCKKQRFFRLIEHLKRAFKLPHMNARIRLISTKIYRFRIFRASKLTHHIFRKVDQHWSRSPCPRNIKRLFNDPSKIFSFTHGHTVLCNTSCDSYDIHFLKRIVSDQMAGHLTCKTN